MAFFTSISQEDKFSKDVLLVISYTYITIFEFLKKIFGRVPNLSCPIGSNKNRVYFSPHILVVFHLIFE